jgi:hypothetical protein
MKTRWPTILGGMVLLISAGVFFWIAYEHVHYPGFLESMEGDILQHVERASRGEPIYVPPSAEYIPLAYMPGYYWFCVPFYLVLGDSLAGPRLLSVMCAAGSAGLLAFLAWKHTQSLWPALWTAAAFFAGERTKDGCLTIALPDMLLLWWVLLGWTFLIHARSRWHDLLAILCFTLAFWTKQHGAFYFGWAVLYVLLRPRMSETTTATQSEQSQTPAWWYLVGVIIGGSLLFILAELHLGPNFKAYTLDIPAGWERSYLSSVQRMAFVTTQHVPFAMLLAGFYALSLKNWKLCLADPFLWMAGTSLMTSL